MIICDIYNKVKITFSNQEKYQQFLRKQGVTIGKGCDIYKNVKFGTEPYLISIGNHVRLTNQVEFITHDGAMWVLRYLKKDNRLDLIKPIVIEDNVFVGWGGVILPGIRIGKNSIVAAKALVTKDIPANQVWGGVPACFIKTVDQYYQNNEKDIMYTHEMDGISKEKYLKELFCNREAMS